MVSILKERAYLDPKDKGCDGKSSGEGPFCLPLRSTIAPSGSQAAKTKRDEPKTVGMIQDQSNPLPKQGEFSLFDPPLPKEPGVTSYQAKVFVPGGGGALLVAWVPQEVIQDVVPGCRVILASTEGERKGLVYQVFRAKRRKPRWTVKELIDRQPVIGTAFFVLARELASYYCAPLSLALKTMLPACLWENPSSRRRAQAKWLELGAGWVAAQGSLSGEDPSEVEACRWLEERSPIPISQVIRKTRWPRDFWERLVAKGWVVFRDPPLERSVELCREESSPVQVTLSREQKDALAVLTQSLDRGPGHPILLYGVTGSGKTEIYFEAIDHVLKRGGSALLLVPERALTPQHLERLKARFPAQDAIAVWHSGLSETIRVQQWWRIQRGEIRVVLGTRSALFLPLRKLSLIVLDEEQDPSYKQREGLRYHARQAAMMRAQLEGALVVLGSATPSLESWYKANQGEYRLVKLQARAGKARLPWVHVVDLRLGRRSSSSRKPEADEILAPFVREQVQKCLEQGKQVLIYVNRRGYAGAVQCQVCGEVVRCPRCSVALAFHKSLQALLCHYCTHRSQWQEACPRCGAIAMKLLGRGTERIEELLRELFPQVRLLRADSDSLKDRSLWEAAVRAFRKGELDILVGTQILSKGLDFPGLGCVVVLEWDFVLSLPDFRATERAFQQLTQVAGRAGRAGGEAHVFLQTCCPHHPAIQFARHHDFEGFAESELELRQKFFFPPFAELVLLSWEGRNQERTRRLAEQAHDRIMEALGGLADVGPCMSAPIERIRDRYRFQVLIKTRRLPELARKLFTLQSRLRDAKVRLEVDVDPVEFW